MHAGLYVDKNSAQAHPHIRQVFSTQLATEPTRRILIMESSGAGESNDDSNNEEEDEQHLGTTPAIYDVEDEFWDNGSAGSAYRRSKTQTAASGGETAGQRETEGGPHRACSSSTLGRHSEDTWGRPRGRLRLGAILG